MIWTYLYRFTQKVMDIIRLPRSSSRLMMHEKEEHAVEEFKELVIIGIIVWSITLIVGTWILRVLEGA